MTTSTMDLRVGNKYRIGRKIGSGSFGDIYLGKLQTQSRYLRPSVATRMDLNLGFLIWTGGADRMRCYLALAAAGLASPPWRRPQHSCASPSHSCGQQHCDDLFSFFWSENCFRWGSVLTSNGVAIANSRVEGLLA